MVLTQRNALILIRRFSIKTLIMSKGKRMTHRDKCSILNAYYTSTVRLVIISYIADYWYCRAFRSPAQVKYWYGLIFKLFFSAFFQLFVFDFCSFFSHFKVKKESSKQMIKCWSRLLLLCMQFDHWTCYKTLLVFHLSTSSRHAPNQHL